MRDDEGRGQEHGQEARFQVLVFSHTNGFRHASIEKGVELVTSLGNEHNFTVEATEDSTFFAREDLTPYEAIIFMNTNGDVLAREGEAALEAYIQQGGGFVGVHSAAATEYDWAWYGGLVGAYFDNHPVPQEASLMISDPLHPSTKHLPVAWNHFDEWYNYRSNPRGKVHVLATLDEGSYEGGEMGHDHPIAWAHTYDGGRAWYTGLGHTLEAYEAVWFQQHLLGGIEWAAGMAEGDVDASLASNYKKKVLMDAVTDPMEIAIAEDGRVFMVERAGAVKVWDPATEATSLAGWIPVNMIIEDGLLGLTLDPDFSDNNWLYVYYAPQNDDPSRLSRFTLVENTLDMDSEKILLEVDVQRTLCCHSGGSLAFDAAGNLYLSTGDNTNATDRTGSPMDERPGFRLADAQRTSANTNDLRGKILRITPQDDGTYTIPEGNLFEGDALRRPEIYTMGHRNPFRIAIDQKTGWLYWGDVGNGNAPSGRGGWGWDEFNLAKGPGNFGWPHFAGNNEAFKEYDYETKEIGPPFDAAAPLNDSPNNTGAQILPPAQPAWLWYTYGGSEEFPELGAGGINPMAGPVYYMPDNPAPYALPAYFEGKPIIYEWMRNWVKEVIADEEGNVLEINPFLPGIEFVRPIDIEIGPDGAIYIAEWGDAFWGSNENAQVVRLEYLGREDVTDQPVAAIAREEDAPEVHIEYPVHGSVFAFDRSMPYSVSIKNSGDAAVDTERLSVRVYSGFDTHSLLLSETNTLSGSVEVTRAFTHTPDLHFVDRFAELEACYTNEQGVEGCSKIKLQPEKKEAEHTLWTRGGRRHSHGTHPASEMYPITAMITMQLKAGDSLAYGPLRVDQLASLSLRYKQHANGSLVLGAWTAGEARELIRFDLAEIETREVEAVEQILATDAAVQHDEALDVSKLDRTVYENWSEVTLDIPEWGDEDTLYLTVESDDPGMIVELDWMKFGWNAMSIDRVELQPERE